MTGLSLVLNVLITLGAEHCKLFMICLIANYFVPDKQLAIEIGGGGVVCSDCSIYPFDIDLSNRKLELQLTSFGDRLRDNESKVFVSHTQFSCQTRS